jgi:hypothetical protein
VGKRFVFIAVVQSAAMDATVKLGWINFLSKTIYPTAMQSCPNVRWDILQLSEKFFPRSDKNELAGGLTAERQWIIVMQIYFQSTAGPWLSVAVCY